MNRALFVDVACFTDEPRENRLLGQLSSEYLPLPIAPEKVAWDRLDPALAIDLSASWLLADGGSPTCRDAALSRRLARCVAVGRPGIGSRGRPASGWTAAPDLPAALALAKRETARSRVLTDYQSIGRIARRLRAARKRIVFTNGVFDLFHLGHLRLLEAAASLGDALIVGVNSDESAGRLKGRSRPVVPQFARAAIVAGARPVDWAVVFVEDSPLDLLRIVRPHLLVKGGEYRPADVVGARLVRSWGGRVVIAGHVEGWSTSGIVRRIKGRSP